MAEAPDLAATCIACIMRFFSITINPFIFCSDVHAHVHLSDELDDNDKPVGK